MGLTKLEREWGKTAGDKDPAKEDALSTEFVEWIDDLVRKAEKAKKEIQSKGTGRDSAEFIGKMNSHKHEKWYDYFYG